MRTLKEMKNIISCGLNESPCDYKLMGVSLVNVMSSEIYMTDIYIKDKRIVSIDPKANLKSNNTVDCKGLYALPGFIDSHMHFESTMLSPEALTNVVVPTGTTTLMADLMEIANVSGSQGLEEMIKSINDLPYRMLIEVSSRVPTAPGLETNGALLDSDSIDKLLDWDSSISLGEMDSSKILITREDDYLKKILSALKRHKVVNGHAIGRLGQELNVFASSGISDDHECVNEQEMIERLRVGMKIFIREGSSERNVEELIKSVLKNNLETDNLMFCTDDKHISDIKKEGHINYNVNLAITLGLSPMKAIQMATINPAKHFRIEEDLGSLTPGRYADIILCENINNITPKEVWFEGMPVSRSNKMIQEVENRKYPDWIKNTVKLKKEISPNSFVITHSGSKKNQCQARIIKLIKNQIINTEINSTLTVNNNIVQNDLQNDILKIAVVERYGKNGNIGIGFVNGFELKSGAIAYSMSHDHHNIVVVGTNDKDMAACVNHIANIQGGACVAKDSIILADMHLPIGGLMSEKSTDEVERELNILNQKAKDLGCSLTAPFMSLSFVSLPTVPDLGITDKGLVDVINHKIIDLIK